ncbi:hypothetical protein WME79_12430 [Sorangium sp. So ce726]|uniref:hypothetical protein n=1 Tax=Sorangium sp. So ce726 TaxID=3133319 RepID=UPI003F5DB158
MGMRALGSLLMVSSLGLLACGDPDPDFEAKREQWASARPQEYVIQTRFTGVAGSHMLYAVSADTIIAEYTSIKRFAEPEDWEETGDSPRVGDPVQALFDAAEGARRCDLREIEFDPKYGFVSIYYHDCGEEGGGEEVPCFAPDTTDVAVCMNQSGEP